jgi:hypothetical protein
MARLGDQTENDHVDVALFLFFFFVSTSHTAAIYTQRNKGHSSCLIFQFSLHHCQQQRERKQQ